MMETAMTPFHALHAADALGGLLILPNAWDGGSAALVASLGARAVATTKGFLIDGRSEPLMEGALGWGEINALMPARD